MTAIEIPRPPWAQGLWSWPWPPSAAGVLGLQLNAWRKAVIDSSLAWAQRMALDWWDTLARRWDVQALPPGTMDGLTRIASRVVSITKATTASAVLREVRAAVGDAFELARTLSGSLGRTTQAPIVGWIMAAIATSLDVAVAILEQREAEQTIYAPTTYDPDAAAYYQAEVLALATSDVERVFLPWGRGPVVSVRVRGGGREWTQAERADGMGYVPCQGLRGAAVPGRIIAWWRVDTDRSARYYYERTRWVVAPSWVQPGTMEACDAAWRRCQSAPGIFDLNPRSIVRAWDEWEAAWWRDAASLSDDAQRARRWQALYLPVDTPTKAVTTYDGKVYSQATPLTVWVEWARRLESAQRSALRTVGGVAYTSEDQRAFVADPELRAVLRVHRGLLLHHPAVAEIDAAAVPDREFRRAVLRAQRRRRLGPTSITARTTKKESDPWRATLAIR